MLLPLLWLLFYMKAIAGHAYNAVETEMFSIPISPNLFNWTYQEFDQQYRFHASLIGKPELPTWLRYIYSGRHHSGFIFGTPPRNTDSPISIEVVGLNRQDYETRRVLLTLTIQPKEKLARHEVEFKIDNLNVEDLLDEHRLTRLKNILRTKLWTESVEDLYATFLASAIDLGARLPLKPSDGEGLVIRLGSTVAFSSELKRLREEVRPLSRLPSCPREYKRTTVERLFRDAGFTLDWCSFELYNTIYSTRSTDHLEYLTEIPSPKSQSRSLDREVWSAPNRQSLPSRSYAKQLAAALAAPVALLLLSLAALTAVLCFHYAAVSDPESDIFLEGIYHVCDDYTSRRAHRSANVEICRYGTSNTENTQATQADNTSSKSLGVSPNSSLARPYSPKSTTNLAGSYNRPQPPPYGTLHHRKLDKTPDNRSHSLEESLKLLNEANITNEFERDPIIDYSDGTDDYIQIKPDRDYIIQVKMQNDLDDIVVPELAKYGISGIGPI